MEYIADLEVHSRFARAVSKEMNLETLENWGTRKGVNIIGTGDFTHPVWFAELKEQLIEAEPGLYQRNGSGSPVRFLLSAEVSCIFSHGGRARRVHILLYAPSLAVVEEINGQLGLHGAKLKSDGRPIVGISAQELATIAFTASPQCLVIPAHVWTPWFGMYGSKSGFDSLAECFGPIAPQIAAIETGLSSDPAMNWRIRELDTKAIVSFSDAHSARNIGREATVFSLRELSYAALAGAIRQQGTANQISRTIEFFPEEGMYHWDGHRGCNIRWSPEETKKNGGVCPRCGKAVTVGVMNRVDQLADPARPAGFDPSNRPPFQRLVPLAEIIAEARGVGKLTKTVATEYETLLTAGGNEFNLLLKLSVDELKEVTNPLIAEGIRRVRDGQLQITPGFDGTYGIIKVFTEDERKIPGGQETMF